MLIGDEFEECGTVGAVDCESSRRGGWREVILAESHRAGYCLSWKIIGPPRALSPPAPQLTMPVAKSAGAPHPDAVAATFYLHYLGLFSIWSFYACKLGLSRKWG